MILTKQLTITTILASILITGCASMRSPRTCIPHPTLTWPQHQQVMRALTSWSARGKIGVTDAKKGGNASFNWHQQANSYKINLYGPLNADSAEIIGKPNSVHVTTSKGEKFTAKTPEEIMQNQLECIVPISGIIYWIKGIPMPNKPIEAIQISSDNKLTNLKQMGWDIEFCDYKNFNEFTLPTKILLQYKQIKVKLILKEFDI